MLIGVTVMYAVQASKERLTPFPLTIQSSTLHRLSMHPGPWLWISNKHQHPSFCPFNAHPINSQLLAIVLIYPLYQKGWNHYRQSLLMSLSSHHHHCAHTTEPSENSDLTTLLKLTCPMPRSAPSQTLPTSLPKMWQPPYIAHIATIPTHFFTFHSLPYDYTIPITSLFFLLSLPRVHTCWPKCLEHWR